MDSLLGREAEMSQQVGIFPHLYGLNIGLIHVGLAVGRALGISASGIQVSSQMFRGFVVKRLPLCLLALLSERRLTLALITEQEALPWHHFDTQVFLHSSPGRAVATEAKLPSVFSLTVCI